MKVLVLFGSRKATYPGQYAPEALECIDEYVHEEFPTYLTDKKAEYLATNDFDSLEIITLEVNENDVSAKLFPSRGVLKASVQ